MLLNLLYLLAFTFSILTQPAHQRGKSYLEACLLKRPEVLSFPLRLKTILFAEATHVSVSQPYTPLQAHFPPALTLTTSSKERVQLSIHNEVFTFGSPGAIPLHNMLPHTLINSNFTSFKNPSPLLQSILHTKRAPARFQALCQAVSCILKHRFISREVQSSG